VVIVEVMSTVLSISILTTPSNESGLDLVTVMETYGQFLVNAVDDQAGLEVATENISTGKEQVPS